MPKNETLLITGGTGTFGHAVLKGSMAAGYREIRIFSRDEKKQDEMRNALRDPKVKFYLGNVRDYDSILPAMRGVDVVFHAAALKQVPSCEFFPLEAVRTNTLGAENVMNAALECGAKKVIVLSTDKAVYPINAMGMSKALMEKMMVAKGRAYGDANTVFCGTRYGNVMGSRGSVIPLFIEQILRGEPLTVTDPAMTRFMMPIDGAVGLVSYAFSHGRPGDLFVQKAPAATIGTLAEALFRIFAVKENIRIIEKFVEKARLISGIKTMILHGKEQKDRASVLLIGANIDPGAVKALCADTKEKYNFVVSTLSLTDEQYDQMSHMGLYSGPKKILFDKNAI